jgi:hypothetical protein
LQAINTYTVVPALLYLKNINRSQLLATGAEPCGREEQGGSKAETPEEAGIIFFFVYSSVSDPYGIHASLTTRSAQSRKFSNLIFNVFVGSGFNKKNLRLAPDSVWIRIRKHPWVPDPESVTKTNGISHKDLQRPCWMVVRSAVSGAVKNS